MVPAAGVEIADPAEESASSVGAPVEVQAPVVVAAARDCVHTGVHRGAPHRAWTERHDLCEGRVARVFRQVLRDWRRVHGRQEDLRLWESSFNVHAGQCWRWDAVLLRPPWAPVEFDGFLRDYASCGRQSSGRPARDCRDDDGKFKPTKTMMQV